MPRLGTRGACPEPGRPHIDREFHSHKQQWEQKQEEARSKSRRRTEERFAENSGAGLEQGRRDPGLERRYVGLTSPNSQLLQKRRHLPHKAEN